MSLVMVITVVAIARTQAVLARHRAESTSDLAALAAAAQIGLSDDGCVVARHVAAANNARLIRCVERRSDDGLSGRVEVRVSMRAELLGWLAAEVEASARAGRDPPEAAGPVHPASDP